METLQVVETTIVLLAVVLALATLAHGTLIPYPIFLVLGGLAIALIPGVPVVTLNPDLVFFVFLPPILWSAAYFTSLRDFRANLRPITLYAVGLVLVTTFAVAAAARALIPGLGWPAALALGAIVSPPDAVAATAIGRRLKLPRRVLAILEGESLLNDATALVLYRAAVAAMAGGSFVLSRTLVDFVVAAVGAIVVGLAVGAVIHAALRFARDSATEIAITLLAPYMAWTLAERVHASGVLACVLGGFFLRQHMGHVVGPLTRTQARVVWDLLVFLLNGAIFMLIGLQLATLRVALASTVIARLLWQGAAVSATAIGVRLLWVPIAAYVPRLLSPSLRARDPVPPWSHIAIVGWTSMRGIVSLAAALALPQTSASGQPLPFRNEIILLSFSVILVTLLLQGLSLPLVVRALGFRTDDAVEREESEARLHAARAALERLDHLAGTPWPRADHIERLRLYYGQRAQRSSRLTDGGVTPDAAAALRRLRHETLTAERRAITRLRDQGAIGDEALQRLEHDLDVEAIRIGLGELRTEAHGSPSSGDEKSRD